MINVRDNEWIPSLGYKYLSDGETWTDMIYLGRADNIERWHDTNDEPPEPSYDENPTAEDYEAALNRMGVAT